MYRKIYRLRSQFEKGEIDEERAKILLGSILEQAGAMGNQDACLLAAMSDEWISKHEWKADKTDNDLAKIAEELKEGTLLDELELLAWSLAAKDLDKMEKALCERHGEYDFDNMEAYHDDGVITEHFTDNGNVFVWLRDDKSNEVAYIQGNEVKILDCSVLGSINHKDQIKLIKKELEKRGL